jgi:hypothetical protein
MCVWVLVAGLVILAPFGIVYRETGELPLDLGDSPNPLGFFLYVAGVPALIAIVGAAVVLARTVPDLVGRRIVEGIVVSRERVLFGATRLTDIRAGYNYYLDVRDSRSGVVERLNIGSEHYSRLGSSMYYYVQEGDTVRLTVTPRLRRVVRIEVLRDREGHALPPVGRVPGTPSGAPVTAEEFMEITRLALRSVDWVDTASAEATVRMWTYQLAEVDAQVRMYVALGERGERALCALAAPGIQTRHRLPSLGIGGYRLEPAGLLIASELISIGVQKSGRWTEFSRWSWMRRQEYPSTWWDEHLLRCAVDRHERGQLGLPPRS